MLLLDPRVRLIVMIVLLLGVIGLDLTIDIAIYTGFVFLILILSPRRLLPIIIPIPIFLSIVGSNLFFLREPGLFKAFRFYFASTIALQYSSISSGEDITTGISWLFKCLRIKGGELVYGCIVQAKKMTLKDLTLKNIPERIAELIRSDAPIESPKTISDRIEPRDIAALAAVIVVSTAVLIT